MLRLISISLLLPTSVDAWSAGGRHLPPLARVCTRPTSIVACAPPSQAEAPDPAASNAAAAGSTEPIDPKDALKELPKLTQQIQELWTEGKTWGVEERTERRRKIVDSYVRVFAPALALSGVQLGLSFGVFFVSLLALNLSGIGYAQLVSALEGVPLLGDAIGAIDPAWGNAAISLAIVEVVNVPLLLPIAAVATPPATEKLSAWLTEKGFDAEGLNAKIEAVLEKTS